MKLKQLLLSRILYFLLLLPSIGEGQQHLVANNINAPGDSSFKKDAPEQAIQPLNDLKQGFKDIFLTGITGGSITGARLNPMAASFVEGYIAKNKKGMMAMKVWCRPYFDLIDAILTQHGLPRELKYLAVIESGLKYNNISWTGAVGPWALMPAAAREYGLTVTRYYDERLDYYKSTHAAARLLTDLYAKYEDWLLVIAAYNGGPGNVNRAIKKSGGSKDFWTLQYHLPNESMNHVKKFIGAHYIFEGEGGITTITKNEMKDLVLTSNSNPKEEEEEVIDSLTAFPIAGRFNSSVIVRYTGIDIATFNRYNPDFDNEVAIKGKYELRLPAQKMDVFISKKYEILYESIQLLLNPKTIGTK